MKKLSRDVMENFTQQHKLITDIGLLEECINDKWLPICMGDYVGHGTKDCALCKKYYKPNFVGVATCNSCPIATESGENECEATPYRKSSEGWVLGCSGSITNKPNFQAACKRRAYAELFYLHDLADSLRDQLKELQDEQV